MRAKYECTGTVCEFIVGAYDADDKAIELDENELTNCTTEAAEARRAWRLTVRNNRFGLESRAHSRAHTWSPRPIHTFAEFELYGSSNSDQICGFMFCHQDTEPL